MADDRERDEPDRVERDDPERDAPVLRGFFDAPQVFMARPTVPTGRVADGASVLRIDYSAWTANTDPSDPS